MAQQKYLDYAGLQRVIENIDRKYAPISAIVFKSSVDDLASLPALNTQKAGFMYSVKVGGITTSDFVEGAGHIVADGENVAAVELYTGNYTQVAAPAATDDPKALGWYEIDSVTYEDVTASLDPSDSPVALGLYEEDTSTTPVSYVLTADVTIVSGKSYFEKVTTYVLSQDRLPAAGKDYFTADTVMKWDLMGGVFDLEGRYLEFGDTFPQSPASRMVDGRTFLFMGGDQVVYTYVDTPTGRPVDNGYYEVDFLPVPYPDDYYNPKQQDLYEEDPVTTGAYVLSSDTTVNVGKTYYAVDTATPSTDPAVDPLKFYYTQADQYRKAVIYQYDSTAADWIPQSSGGAGDFIPITNAEIDDLFI